jgi:hypothetical protein
MRGPRVRARHERNAAVNAAFIAKLIEQDIILVPKFIPLWDETKITFSAEDQATVDSALGTKVQAADGKDAAATE